MQYYLRIVRPKNLLIVALSQWLIFLLYFNKSGVEQSVFALSGFKWLLFILDTVLIAAAGYVINDIYDTEADQLNKPQKVYIGNGKLSLVDAWKYYWALVGLGFAIACYIGINIREPQLILIFPFVSLLLFLYSRSLKHQPLSGNLVVAIFCAFVPGIVWFAERDYMLYLSVENLERYRMITLVFSAYIMFGFFVTIAREIVKDIEDMDGDLATNANTFPIAYGVEIAKTLVVLCLVICLCIGLLMGYYAFETANLLLVNALSLCYASFVIYILYAVFKAKGKQDFTVLSRDMKKLMVFALVVFLLIPLL